MEKLELEGETAEVSCPGREESFLHFAIRKLEWNAAQAAAAQQRATELLERTRILLRRCRRIS